MKKKLKFEISIIIIIIILIVLINIPKFLTCRCGPTNSGRALHNLRAISDNIASYGIYEKNEIDSIIRLWPSNPEISSAGSYIRKQLLCPIDRNIKCGYLYSPKTKEISCMFHGGILNILNKVIDIPALCQCTKGTRKRAKEWKRSIEK